MLASLTEVELFTDHESRDAIAQLILMSIAIIFTSSVVYGIFSKNSKPLKIGNNFDLGYITDDEPLEEEIPTPVSSPSPRPSKKSDDDYDELKSLKRQVEIAKLKKQLAGLQNPTEPRASKPKVNVLLDACQAALVSLGVPKRKAKAEADVVLQSNPSIKTVQDFITEYGKR